MRERRKGVPSRAKRNAVDLGMSSSDSSAARALSLDLMLTHEIGRHVFPGDGMGWAGRGWGGGERGMIKNRRFYRKVNDVASKYISLPVSQA